MIRKYIWMALLVSPLLFAFNTLHLSPVTLKGTVVDDTSKPLQGAYVYIVKGEEEALTNEKGEFFINTYQPQPLMLTVIHQRFKTTQLKIRDVNARPSITLQKK